MSVTELKAAMEDKVAPIVVFDCSVDKDPAVAQAAYNKNHVAGAHFFNMNKWIDTSKVPFAFNFPEATVVSESLKALGINKDSKVCCYDQQDGKFAGHCASVLSIYGFASVSMMSGSFETGFPAPAKIEDLKAAVKGTATTFEIKKRDGVYATFEDVLAATKSEDSVIIDCRTAMLFKKGAIDKAVNLPLAQIWGKHTILPLDVVSSALKAAKIETGNKKFVLYGNGQSGLAKAVLECYGVSKNPIKIYEAGLPEWLEKKPKEKDPKEEGDKKKDEGDKKPDEKAE